ncbi:putative flap endonuclease-1 (FEN-1) [Leptomonas seymouri]|uniref:Flap endonuclease 1 n=1 Tax=Leptomonas seymouri TaxID=5684 RepID=A0A0N1PDC1_LEPSE|nr:putative flap endonuclease-1 (FEN-1) [Leptomonas seymouri]|eukprot:KPI86793.1 putative flap endonuclease-1 (FEN-1) [Leptomonas seymouri]
MGILGLSKLLYDKAPNAIKEQELKNFFGRRVAIDASMSIYQFLIAMKGFQDGQGMELTNEQGEVTSHLNGLFTRTLRMIDEGIKPIYVFDGKPPQLKAGELASRRQKAADAEKEFEKAKDAGDDEMMEKMSKRAVHVSREQTEECKKLLQLMGVPVVQAPSEAEAQCAELVKKGKAWGVGTEDMDALTFGASIMLRHLNISDAKKRPILEIHLDDVLQTTGLSMNQFIDLCILLGCDYVPKVSGIGPQKAWEGIQRYGSIEAFLESLDTTKHTIPTDFHYREARTFFQNPEVIPAEDVDIQFTEPDEEGLMQFLAKEKLFNPDRVLKGVARLRAALTKKTQGRLDSFFTITKIAPVATDRTSLAGKKRPRDGKAVHVSGTLQKSTSGHKKAVKK